MPHAQGHYEGVEPTFDELRQAAMRRIRAQQAPQAQRIASSVRAAGVQTSGVGQLPGLEAERNRSASEAQLETGIAEQRLGQLGALEQLQHQAAIQRQRDEWLANYGTNEERTAARERLQAALIGAGAGAISGAIGKRIGLL
jgi:hypothetical protein